jgi:hypothetical protein
LSAWCRQGESGFGEASVDEVAAVLDLAETVSKRAHEVIGIGEGGVGLAATSQQGPDALDGLRSGA